MLTLHGAIDDATSTVCALHFRRTEDLHGYATVLAQTLATYGVPLALYGDGINILVRNDRHWTVAEHLTGHQTPTHLGRVLQDLSIGYIQARSPQAKGRIERLWQTLQDRLVSELRLHRIASLEAAHAFLPARTTVKIRYRKDRGVWEVDYRDRSGQRHRPLFASEEEAHEHATEILRTSEQEIPETADRDITLRAYPLCQYG